MFCLIKVNATKGISISWGLQEVLFSRKRPQDVLPSPLWMVRKSAHHVVSVCYQSHSIFVPLNLLFLSDNKHVLVLLVYWVPCQGGTNSCQTFLKSHLREISKWLQKVVSPKKSKFKSRLANILHISTMNFQLLRAGETYKWLLSRIVTRRPIWNSYHKSCINFTNLTKLNWISEFLRFFFAWGKVCGMRHGFMWDYLKKFFLLEVLEAGNDVNRCKNAGSLNVHVLRHF